eukprot:1185994-Prorocentrum_minimum.AAC.1
MRTPISPSPSWQCDIGYVEFFLANLGVWAPQFSTGVGVTGKSSVTVALLNRLQQQGKLAAYHLLKYSDQRRLDTVRTIKSLAFQLAVILPAFAQKLLSLPRNDVVRTQVPRPLSGPACASGG